MLDLGLSTTSTAIILTGKAVIAPPYPPPPGHRWDAVTERGIAIRENNQFVIELVRNAA